MTPIEEAADKLIEIYLETKCSINENAYETLLPALAYLHHELKKYKNNSNLELARRQERKSIPQLIEQARALCDGPVLCHCGAERNYNNPDKIKDFCGEPCSFITNYGRHIIASIPLALVGELVDALEQSCRLPDSKIEAVSMAMNEAACYLESVAKDQTGPVWASLLHYAKEIRLLHRTKFLIVEEPFSIQPHIYSKVTKTTAASLSLEELELY